MHRRLSGRRPSSADVSEKEKTAVVEICEKEDAAGRLLALLQDVWRSDAEENASIRLGRKTLAFGAMDAQLYVLSSFVNLAYFGGCGQLREKPQGLELSPMQLFVDTLLYPDNSDSVLFYAVSGLYNLSNDDSFAKLLSSEQKEKEVLAKLESLASSSSNPDTKNYASGTLDHWKTHYQGAWPPQ